MSEHSNLAGTSSPASASRSQSPPATTNPANLSSPFQRPPSQGSPQPSDAAVDPRVAELCSMFPDFDEAILQSVLESVNWNQDRAVDTLLGMSDPNYKSENRQEERPLSQTELDEQLARRLHLEDQERHGAWVAQQMHGPRRSSYHQGGVPPTQSPPNQEGSTMAEVQDQFNKIAETGKKTLGNLFSKVKAKIQEFETGRPAGSSPPQQQWSTPPQTQQWVPQAQYPTYQPYHPHSHRPSPSHNSGPPSPPIQLNGPQPAFYDPNPLPASLSTPSPPVNTVSASQVAPKEVTGYDVTTPLSTSPPPTTTPPSPKVLDPGKLGMLPKRPVSLLRPQSPPQAGGASSTAATSTTPPPSNPAPGKPEKVTTPQTIDYDNENVLDYAESPFEDHRK
ncbi:hypothetical protein AX16_006915 [Volvariella volvacea WC 439]|nr:hypothetical protein AX16_006915 [Volvariella volvacea WC 439]